MQMQKCKTWSRCICIVQKMHLHDVIAGIKRFILSPRLRASVYALGSDMKIDGGTFPNSSVGDCFLPPSTPQLLALPIQLLLLLLPACPLVNMHAGFLIRALLDTPHHHPSPPKNLVGQDTLNGGILPDRKIMQSQNQDHQQPQNPLRHPPKTHVDLDRLNVVGYCRMLGGRKS